MMDDDETKLNSAFKADPEERLTQPQAPMSGFRYAFALVIAAMIYAGILSLLFVANWLDADEIPVSQEIPVEILVEAPPLAPPPPPHQEKSPEAPTARPPEDQPATDAPRAANEEKVQREAADEATKAPTPVESKDQPAPSQADDPVKGGAPNAAAAESSAPSEAEPNPPKAPSPQFPTFASVPDIEVSGAAEKTPIAGGKAKATYLTILYGMVVAHMRMPPGLSAGSPHPEGAVVFTVDGFGNLIQRKVVHSSGYRELDLAAMSAVAQAAPFPSPPQNAPIALRFTYGAR
jgi:TonB family protein